MISGASRAAAGGAWRQRLAAGGAVAGRLAARLEGVRPLYVVGGLVLVEWLVTLGLALTVAHNGWVYYQGGDQVWFYTTSWLLGHGHIPPTYVGYGWSVLLMPLTLVGGPDLLHVMPAIVLLDVLVLMPVAMAAMYGIGERLGGRLFGYWVLVVWIAAPLVGIKYTDTGFHQRYTELTLPQAFGLTTLSDFPSLVVLAVTTYFLVRALQRFTWPDATLAGLCAGFAIGLKPANGLYFGGVVLAVALTRRWRATAVFAAALAPSVLVLAFWKWRGLGYLPLFHAEQAVRVALGGNVLPVGTIGIGKYIHFDWGHISVNLDSIREHFWSVRVFEWLVIAGIVALARRALWAAGLFGGWFLAFALIKGSDPLGNVEDASLLRLMIPTIPAFVLMLAALPLLVPAVARRLPRPGPPRPWRSPAAARVAITAAALLFVVVPAALAAAAHRLPAGSTAMVNVQAGPIPTEPALHLRTATSGGRVRLTWAAADPGTARIFYTLMRGSGCSGTSSIDLCPTQSAITTRATSAVDVPPAPGTYVYTVAVSANWRDDPTGGDPYVASLPAVVTVP